MERIDPLLDCLVELAHLVGRPTARAAFISGLPIGAEGLTPSLFGRAAERAGLATKIVRLDLGLIVKRPQPVILLLKENSACLILSVSKDRQSANVLFPESGQGSISINIEDLREQYSGRAIFSRPRFRFDQRAPETSKLAGRHWFWSTFLEQASLFRDIMLAALTINIFALAIPIYTMNVYDRVIPNKAEETLWMLSLGVLMVILLDYLLKVVRTHFIDLAGARIDVKLSSLIMERVMGMRLSDRPASVGSFAQTVRSFESIRDFMSSATVTALIDIPFAVLFLLIIGWISWPLVFVPILASIIVLIYSYLIQLRIHGLTEQNYRASALRNSTLIESLSAIETLKALNAESRVQLRWESTSAQIARLSASIRLKTHSATGMVASISSLCTVSNVVLGVYLISNNMLTMGGLIATGMLVGRIIQPLAQMVGLIMQYESARISLSMIEEQMQKPQERPDDMTFIHRENIEGEIEFKDVKFGYPNQEVFALNGVSFKIAKGEHVAVIGRTGSGKTTLTRLVMGMYQPTEGSIKVDGIELRQLDPADLRSHIGAVEQNTMLFYGTLRENITLSAPHAEDDQILNAADIGMLTDFVNSHPRGFDMLVGERGELLSGGQRQCVAIARATLMSPPIMLFDEPTSSMDFSTESRFIEKMRSFGENRTMLIVTHRMSLLALANRVIVLDQGKIVADGPKDMVLDAINSGSLPKAS